MTHKTLQEAPQALILITVLSTFITGILYFFGPMQHDAHTPLARTTKSQTVCPVMGGPIDDSMYVDVKGKRIYICCLGCEDAINAEPDRYIKKIETRGETVANAPINHH